MTLSSTFLGQLEPFKAILLCYDNPELTMVLQFNPSTLTLGRNPVWRGFSERRKLGGEDDNDDFKALKEQSPQEYLESQGAWEGLSYHGAQNDSLSFKTIFDESEDRDNLGLSPFKTNFGLGNLNSVLDALAMLHKLTLPADIEQTAVEMDLRRPPVIAFIWDEFVFEGVITSLSTELSLFTLLGTPKRAEVTINMTGKALTISSSVEDVLDPNPAYWESPAWSPSSGLFISTDLNVIAALLMRHDFLKD